MYFCDKVHDDLVCVREMEQCESGTDQGNGPEIAAANKTGSRSRRGLGLLPMRDGARDESGSWMDSRHAVA